MKIAIVAGAAHQQLSQSNDCLRDQLRKLGAKVPVLMWNQDPFSDFLDCDLSILRQTWDYQNDPGGYAAWLTRLETLGGRVEARSHLAIWNNDKRTLVELKDHGIPIPQTLSFGDAIDPDRLAPIRSDKIVLKPAFGGSGLGVHLCNRSTFTHTMEKVCQDAPGRPIMAQEFLPGIADGEWKLTCISGTVELAIKAVPRPDEFRINSRFHPKIECGDPPAVAVDVAHRIMALVGNPLYGRVDGIMQDGTFICTEFELTDPDLFLHLAPSVAAKLATAIVSVAQANGTRATERAPSSQR